MAMSITGLPLFYAVFVALAAGLALITVWSRRRLALRVASVALLALTAVIGRAHV